MDKVVLGLSGGVDSAVAARLLSGAGFEVCGLYLDIGVPGGAEEARAVADFLGVPLEIRDISERLNERVCTPFAQAYLRGETPNPCIMCNPSVKFPALLDYADELGAGCVATGHYARAENGALYKGMPANDQSYMLCRLTSEQLRRVKFPLGGYEKAQVRAMAQEFSLPVAYKPDSMEICFIPDGDYAGFIKERFDAPGEGNFVDEGGNVLGRHKGIYNYTVGQRRGLGIATGERIFVSKIIPEKNEVVLSGPEKLYASELEAAEMNWLINMPDEPFKASVRVRHSRTEAGATVFPRGDTARIVFDAPLRAPTPGQSAVCYVKDRLVCAGYIV